VRVAVPNGRGTGARRTIGAAAEAVVGDAFVRNGLYFDQLLDADRGQQIAGVLQQSAAMPRAMVQ
jgi:hypothetical protein